MKLVAFVITAAVLGLSGPAFAQGGSGQQAAATPAANQAVVSTSSDTTRNWMVSGFLGTNFSANRNTEGLGSALDDLADTNSTSANFGGQVAYLARRVLGGEFLADFSPGLGSFQNALFVQSPNVNSYMFNVIAAAPFGHIHSFDPYISGGVGWVTMSSDIFAVDPTRVQNINAIQTLSASGSKFGWDLGGGVMAWSEKNWGFRGDLRYYRTNGEFGDTDFDINNIGDGSTFTEFELGGLSFWKANAGIAFRW